MGAHRWHLILVDDRLWHRSMGVHRCRYSLDGCMDGVYQGVQWLAALYSGDRHIPGQQMARHTVA